MKKLKMIKKPKKRSQKRKNQNTNIMLNAISLQCAGLNSKLQSFDRVLDVVAPSLVFMQETKVTKPIKTEHTESYRIFQLPRTNSKGGGVALCASKHLQPVLLREGDDEAEAISIMITTNQLKIRCVCGYTQEKYNDDQKEKFWEFMSKEVIEAEDEQQGLLIQMDANAYVGRSVLKHDMKPQNDNGKILCAFLKRHPNVSVVNAMDLCEGTVTRIRETVKSVEMSSIDFFFVNDILKPFITKMTIDTRKEFCLTNYAQVKQNGRAIPSDHCPMLLDMNIKYSKIKPVRTEQFNFRNKECQATFKQITEDSNELNGCFENDLPTIKQINLWEKKFFEILFKSFKKIRINNKDNSKMKSESLKLQEERSKLKKTLKEHDETVQDENERIKQKILDIEMKLGDENAKENMRKVETLDALSGESECMNTNGMWQLKKKLFPKIAPQIVTGKKDNKDKLVTDPEELKTVYLEEYLERLRNRPMHPDMLAYQVLEEELFKLRIQIAKHTTSEPWSMLELEVVLASLKEKKARDPAGLVNELLSPGVGGRNLKLSILNIFNKIKSENVIPEFMKMADCTTIYKGKGKKNELKNDRGVFIVSIFRSILLKLIYKRKYDIVDQNMSDSNVGARKRKNVRNHVWILHGVVHDVLSSKTKTPIDFEILDYKQCFDGLWLESCLNDIFESGIKDDTLALLYNVNESVNIAIRTPVGKTERKTIHKVVMQGDVFGSLLCSNQVDGFGKECLEQNKYTYKYKGVLDIPPLGMVDDLVCISECGYKTSMMNAFINHKTNIKKLQFGVDKCKKIHIGRTKENHKCQDLYVDGWKIKNVTNVEKSNEERIETFEGAEAMETTDSEKYLGDIISNDGTNTKNIKNRQNKGQGASTQVILILENIYFGKYYFQAAVALRNSLLISTMLFNSETWYNVTNVELERLEKIDEKCLRKILNAPFATPKIMLYLELGVTPIRYIVKSRRLNFLQYILHEDKSSMLNKFLQIQLNKPTKKDWGSQVKKDIEELELDVKIEDIENMPKITFKKLVKAKVNEHAFKYLESKKKSKTKGVPHMELKIQEYLEPNEDDMSLSEKQFIFKSRSRMLEVKANMKNDYTILTCCACGKEEETQMHLMQCEVLNKNITENSHESDYMDLFCPDLVKMREAGRVLAVHMKNIHEKYRTKRESKANKKKTSKIKHNKVKVKPKNCTKTRKKIRTRIKTKH